MAKSRERVHTETWLQRERGRETSEHSFNTTESWLRNEQERALVLAEHLADGGPILEANRGAILLKAIMTPQKGGHEGNSSNGATYERNDRGISPGSDVKLMVGNRKLSELSARRGGDSISRLPSGSVVSPLRLRLKLPSSPGMNPSMMVSSDQDSEEDEVVSPRTQQLRERAEMQPAEVEEEDEIEIQTLKRFYNVFIAHNLTQAVLILATIVALFLDDVRLISLPLSADSICDTLMGVCMILFGLEWTLNSVYVDGYLWNIFFWLDGLATMSLIPDVSVINGLFFGVDNTADIVRTICKVSALESYGGSWTGGVLANSVDYLAAAQIARAGRAAKIGSRAARLVRIIRILRVLRVFRLCKVFGTPETETGEANEEEIRNDPTKLGQKMAELTSQRVIIVVLSVFVATSLVLSGFSTVDRAGVVGIDFMEATRPITNASVANYINVMRKETDVVCLHDTGRWNQFPPMHYADATTLRQSELVVEWSHAGGIVLLLSTRNDGVQAAIVNISIIAAIVLVLSLSSYVIMQDAQKLVIMPVSRIVTSINKMNKTVMALGGQDCNSGTSMEIVMLESIITKMATLLKIGFGEAGHAIISKNLSSGTGSLNAMLPGRHITAVFGFCYIGQFTDTTEILRGSIMPFVNKIADIVHGHVARNNGYPNKNIGDAFLCAWKTESETKGSTGRGRNQSFARRLSLSGAQMEKMIAEAASGGSPTKGGSRRAARGGGMSPGTGSYEKQANKALQAFIGVIEQVNSDETDMILRTDFPKLYKRRKSFKLNLGFGLHHGWAIEGAIGSLYKVDASYLSPHVNMAARLEAATKQYGVAMLLSGTFVKHLSERYSDRCRQIDRVKVVGSDKVMDLYVCDVPEIDDETFKDTFGEAFELYSDGKWPEATEKLKICKNIIQNDGPTCKLLSMIAKSDGLAPEDWPSGPGGGWHQLMSK